MTDEEFERFYHLYRRQRIRLFELWIAMTMEPTF